MILLDNFSDCLIYTPEKFQVSSTGFEPIEDNFFNNIHLSTTLYKTFFIHSSFLSQECTSPTNWPWSHLSGFIAQLVRALHWHRRGHVFESRWRQLKFFRCIYEAIIESDCLTKCEDHFFNSSLHNTSQNIFHLLIIIIIVCKLNINF